MARKAVWNESAREAKKRWITKNAQIIAEYKKENPCSDCKESYPACVMQFDHLGDDKFMGVTKMIWRGYSLEKVWAEIAKCELVCANCHCIRTDNRRSKC